MPRIALALFAVTTCASLTTGVAWAQPSGCTPSATTLCLHGDRFSVEVEWERPDFTVGNGAVLPFGTDDTGFFLYDDEGAVEMMVRVLDGCSFNGQFWVFAAGVSDYQQSLVVRDFHVGGQVSYDNSQGETFSSVSDTTALPCEARTQGRALSGARGAPAAPILVLADRFEATLEWEDFSMSTGAGNPIGLLERSGIFWVVAETNPEVLVKVVDETATTGFWRLVHAGITSIETTLTVRDRCDGSVQTSTKALGVPYDPIVLAEAFSAPDCVVFADGFETGDASAWTTGR